MDTTEGPPGTVAVIFSSDAARYSAFAADLERLELPPGSVKDFGFGTDTVTLRNELVSRAIDRGSYWVWFISEDHTFPSNAVSWMLQRGEALVAPILLRREEPFYPEAIIKASPLRPFLLDSITGPGTMVEVDALTSPYGVLVRRAVFESMSYPWFSEEDDNDMIGFCLRARSVDVQAFVDTSVRVGHRLIASVSPRYMGGKWELVTSIDNDVEFVRTIRHS